MVGPAALRLAVNELQAKCAMKKRRACRVVGLAPATYYYRARRPELVELREKLKILAAQRPRWGYRRLHVLLKREGHHVNHKLVFRVYRAEGLAVRRKKRKRMASALRVVRPPPTRPREQWTMDFTEDSLSTGRRFRTLNVVDAFTRECLLIEVDHSLPGPRVARLLEQLVERHGRPEVIRVDNGSEFTSRVVDSWAFQRGIRLDFIRPGKPVENAHIESFNGKFRDECLNENWFISLDDARQKIESYRVDYNEVRPHSSLDNQTPMEFARSSTGLTPVAVWIRGAGQLDGRGPLGPEANAPNTIGGTCEDGSGGAYHVDESLDWMKISSVDGLALAAGKRARIEARVFAYDAWSDESLDVFATTTPDDPQWVLLATLRPTGPGAQTLAFEYVLPPGAFQAIRGQYRYLGAAEPCASGIFDDRDDLAFAVEYSPNAERDAQLGAPSCSGAASFCDAGTLLDGRGPLGPESHAPNTIDACADGTAGAYHVDPSVDALLVRTADGSTLRAGATARVEARVFASASFAEEVVDLFVTSNADAAAPLWTHVQTLQPSREGSQVLVGSVDLGAAGRWAIRAHMSRPPPIPDPPPDPLPSPRACGTEGGAGVIDDQDDLAFEVTQ